MTPGSLESRSPCCPDRQDTSASCAPSRATDVRLSPSSKPREPNIAFDATHAWSPTLSTRITLAHARNASTVAIESYDRNGIGLLARFMLSNSWLLESGLGWSRSDYSHTQRRLERRDEERNAALVIRHRLGARELFCSLDWVNSDSTIDDRSFRQQVAQCGMAWSF